MIIGFNYVPRQVPGDAIEQFLGNWKSSDSAWLIQDMKKIKWLGGSVVRLVLPYGNTDSGIRFTDEQGNFLFGSQLREVSDIISNAGLSLALTLFGWRDSSEDGWHMYSSEFQDAHKNYLYQAIEAANPNHLAYLSVKNEPSVEPEQGAQSFWDASLENASLIIDWTYRIVSEVKKLYPRIPVTCGMTSSPKQSWEYCYWQKAWWKDGGCMADFLSLLAPHEHKGDLELINGEGKGRIDNTVWTVKATFGYQGGIFFEELSTKDYETVKSLQTQLERQKDLIKGCCWWELWKREGRENGIFYPDGTPRFPDLFTMQGEAEKGDFE